MKEDEFLTKVEFWVSDSGFHGEKKNLRDGEIFELLTSHEKKNLFI
jgi:hypothetical protein